MVKLWSSKPSLWVRFPFPLFDLIMVFLKFFFNFFFSIFFQNRNFLNVFVVFINWLICLLSITKNSNILNTNLIKFEIEKNIFNKSIFFYFLDILVVIFMQYNKYMLGNRVFSFKIQNLNNNKFYLFNSTNNQYILLYGLRSIWKHLRLWILPITIALLFIYYSFFIRSLPFSKVFFGYLLLANMFYLFISGFVFFF